MDSIDSTTRSSHQEQEEFVAVYNQKDLILYALSVGFGSSSSSSSGKKNENQQQEDEELKYVYERHPTFSAVPTFCLALTFWATPAAHNNHQNVVGSGVSGSGSSYEIPPFPPVTMSSRGTIPKENLVDSNDDISQYPVIHMFQSIEWKCDLPVPSQRHGRNNKQQQIRTRLRQRVLSIIPKSLGTFVTTETEILNEEDPTSTLKPQTQQHLLCTMQATFLVLGIPKEDVIPMISTKSKKRNNIGKKSVAKAVLSNKGLKTKTKPDYEWNFDIASNQALLYRLASGDSNKIHVTGDETMTAVLGLLKEEKEEQEEQHDDSKSRTPPILHGLCTLGIAVRAIVHYVGKDNLVSYSFERLQGRFTKPVFLNDSLTVKLWEISNNNDGGVAGRNTSGGCESPAAPSATTARRCVAFVVVNKTRGDQTVIDQGLVQLRINNNNKKGTDGTITSKL